MTGYYGHRATIEPFEPGVRRYFSPGLNWAERAVFIVPLLGIILLFEQKNGSVARSTWVITGVIIWVLATWISAFRIWPNEERIRRKFQDMEGEGVDVAGEIVEYAKKIQIPSLTVVILYIVAATIMIIK